MGQWKYDSVENRMYTLCNSNSIEDEVHFLFFYSTFQISHNKFADERVIIHYRMPSYDYATHA